MVTRTTKKKTIKKKVAKKATKKKTATRPVGRPTKYTPELGDKAIELMAKGYSKEAVAGALDICKETLYTWMREHKEFLDAISKGEAKSRFFFETKMLDHITHTKNGKQLNGQVFNLNMKNRFGWRDKNEVSVGEETAKTAKTFGFKLDVNPDEVGE